MSLSTHIQDRIKQHFQLDNPEANKVEIRNVLEIEGGWESPIYSFEVGQSESAGNDAEGYVLRLYQGANSEKGGRKDFDLMQKLRSSGISIPKPTFLMAPNSEDPNAYLIMEKIEGNQAIEIMRNNKKDEKRLLKTMAGLQADFHSLDLNEFEMVESLKRTLESGQEFVDQNLDDMKQRIGQYQLKGFEDTIKWLEGNRPKKIKFEGVLIHNDFHPENVLVQKKDGQAFVIDWGFAEIGEGKMDLAWTLLQIEVMLGAEARAKYLGYYEAATKTEIEGLEYFEALKFADRMITIATWLHPKGPNPVAKISKDAIRGNYKVHVMNVYARLKLITNIPLSIIEDL
jgi:aminoglycoside phosphotransferase (APT) family kinase protein